MKWLIEARIKRSVFSMLVSPTLAGVAAISVAAVSVANAQAQTASSRNPVAPVQAPQPAPVSGSLLGGGTASTSGAHATPDASSLRMGPGLYRCDSNRYVAVRRVADDGKTAVLFWNQREHTLKAVDTPSGALRFEDTASGLTWITIVGKSMLLDTRKGQQLANECRG
jgi:hypothetical protein